MSALRRSSPPLDAPASRSRPPLQLADDGSTPAANAVLQQQARIATAFVGDSRARYPGAVKLAILCGAPLAMWGGLIGAGAWIASRIG